MAISALQFLPFTSTSIPKPFNSFQICRPTSPFPLHQKLVSNYQPKKVFFHSKSPQIITRFWGIRATPEEISASESTIEKTQQIIPTDENLGPPIISVLLLIAFAGLSILTVGVIYIAVTDFLQKREREQFEKEETAKKKKSSKKGKAKARTGPRGFGQKIEEDD